MYTPLLITTTAFRKVRIWPRILSTGEKRITAPLTSQRADVAIANSPQARRYIVQELPLAAGSEAEWDGG